MRRNGSSLPAHLTSTAFALWLGATVVTAAENDEEAQIREDCRIEGAMAGLEDDALSEFVRGCIADLEAVKFSNMAKPGG